MSKPKQEKTEAVQQLEKDVAAIREVPKAKVRPINAQRVQMAQSARTVYRAVAPLEDTIEQIVSPTYWIHLQHQLRSLDRIEVIPDDQRFFAELLVLAVARNDVRVVLLSHVELPAVQLGPEIPSDYSVTFAGPYEKFRVLKDGKVLKSQLETADHAKRWLNDHVKAQNL